jgi:hypothetical protein
MPLNRQTYSTSKKKSILEGLSLEDFNLNEADSKLFAGNAEELRREFESSAPLNRKVLIHYDPTVFLDEAFLPKTLQTKETVDQEDRRGLSAQTWRHLTKHRLVTSEVTGRMIARGERTQPFPIIITTACAPNAMGSSSEDLEYYFSDKDPDLHRYKQMMLLTYKRILHAQITNGTQFLIIPPIGLGLYLQKLSPDQQAKAIETNYHALREAIESIGQQNKLQEIICVAPNNDKNQNRYLPKAHRVFLNCHPPIPTTFVPADALETAQKLTAIGRYQVGIVNAGSDRTIGGKYAKIDSTRLPPMEETLSQATDLVYVQAQDKGNRNYQYIKLPDELCCPSEKNQEGFNPTEHGIAIPNYHPPIPTTFVPADALQKLTAIGGYQVGMVNAGSDRTIGGGYTGINPSQLPPMEETLSQARDKGNPNCPGPPSSAKPWFKQQPSECKKNQEDFIPKKLGIAIKKWLVEKSINLDGKIFIKHQNNNFIISFKTSQEAQLFANKLQSDVQIGSHQNPGQAKCVQEDSDYFLVYLTGKDMGQLTEFIGSRVNQNHNSKTTEKLLQGEDEYKKFQKAYTKALAKDQSVCIFGFFRRSNMIFSKYSDMEKVEKYIKEKPNSRSARVYNDMKKPK